MTGEPPKQPVEPARVEITVIDPILNIGDVTEIYYNIYDNKSQPINGTQDSWDWTPKDAANITSKGFHSFSFKALKPGTVTLRITAKGDSKTASNTTNITILGESVPKEDPFVKAMPYLVLVIALAVVLVVLLFMRQKKNEKKRKRPKEEGIEDILLPKEVDEEPPEGRDGPSA
jgi:hypothetical protein